jgi:type II secretory pathway pseudopilin PulG
MNLIFKKEKAFTIIELIISIFILSVAVVGIFSAFSTMVILTSDAADKLTATYLAQEGLEIVRNVRDTNWLKTDTCSADPTCTDTYSWVDGLGVNDQSCLNGCKADFTTGTAINGAHSMTPWTSSPADYLKINANGFYGYSSCDPSDPRYSTNSNFCQTKFKRKIIITPLLDANGTTKYYILDVMVEVAWDQKATLLNPTFLTANDSLADDCTIKAHKNNCVKIEETMYDWYNYNG